jgi:glycosyltransferase involved in cell wall biosynthesis
MSVLSHGKPSVGTKGHVTDPEWDEWGVVDLFAKEADREMASRVCELMADARTRLAMGQKARNLYEKYFIPQRMAEKLLVPKQNTPA